MHHTALDASRWERNFTIGKSFESGTASSQGTVYKAVRSQPAVAQAGTRLAQMHISSGPAFAHLVLCSLLLAACALVHTQAQARPLCTSLVVW